MTLDNYTNSIFLTKSYPFIAASNASFENFLLLSECFLFPTIIGLSLEDARLWLLKGAFSAFKPAPSDSLLVSLWFSRISSRFFASKYLILSCCLSIIFFTFSRNKLASVCKFSQMFRSALLLSTSAMLFNYTKTL